EKFSADKDCLRLGKSPDNIFYVVQIDARLTANGGVYLGEQGRRNLDEIYPSLIGRGCESTHIGNHSSAQIDHQCFSVCTEIQHRFPNTNTKINIFVFFSRVDFNDIVIRYFGKGSL